MVRSDSEIESAIGMLGNRWKYNEQSPASHRTIERGASEALEDALDDSVDTDILYEYLEEDGYDSGTLMDLFEFGYVDAVLWYLERETLTEQMNGDYDPVLDDSIDVE